MDDELMEVDPSTPVPNKQKLISHQFQQNFDRSYNSDDNCNLKLSLSPTEKKLLSPSSIVNGGNKQNGHGPKIVKSIRPNGVSPNAKTLKPQTISDGEYSDNPFMSKPKVGFEFNSPPRNEINADEIQVTVDSHSPLSPNSNDNMLHDEWESHKKRSSTTRKMNNHESPTANLSETNIQVKQQQQQQQPQPQTSPNLKQVSSFVSSTTDISSTLDDQSNGQQNPQLQLLISSSSNSSNTTSTSSISSSNKDDKIHDDHSGTNSETDQEQQINNISNRAIRQITDRRSLNLNQNDFNEFEFSGKNFMNEEFKEPMENIIDAFGETQQLSNQSHVVNNFNPSQNDANCLLDFGDSNNENNKSTSSSACNNTSLKNHADDAFDSIFTNDNEFQSFLDCLEKRSDEQSKTHKYSEFARKSLYLLFDPIASKKLSPEKLSRLSIIQDKQEAIKIYLGGITEENENQLNNSSISNNQSTIAASTSTNSSQRTSLNIVDEQKQAKTETFSANNEIEVNASSRKVRVTNINNSNNENTGLDACKMASSDESDKLENVNSEETSDHDEIIDSSSSDNLNKQTLTNENLDNNNHADAFAENNHQNGINGNDADDDNLGEAPAKFSLDSKFLKDETSESSFDFKVNGSVPNGNNSLLDIGNMSLTNQKSTSRKDSDKFKLIGDESNLLDDLQIFAKPLGNSSQKTYKAPESPVKIATNSNSLEKKSSSNMNSISSVSPSTVTSVTAISDDDLSTASNMSNSSVSKLINELNLMKEKEKSYLERISCLDEENQKFKTVVVDYDCLFHNLIKDKDEAEGKLKNEIIELTKERDHLQEDVIGVERAFDDLHRRFEKLKTKVEEFKKNEETLQNAVEGYKQQLEKERIKYSTLKKHAEEKLEQANSEIEKLRKSTSIELQTIKAELRKAEIKISSLELSVQQKDQENSQLTNLLEDLINKVKPNN